jgi:hypothetical protein
MWAWLYATRIPAMVRLKVTYDPRRPPSEFENVIPPEVRWKADNYNHLMEQPTIFYALCFYVVLAGHSDTLNVDLAWAYVGLRVLHSLIQGTVNIVNLRFIVFALSTLALMAIAARQVLALI